MQYIIYHFLIGTIIGIKSMAIFHILSHQTMKSKIIILTENGL